MFKFILVFLFIIPFKLSYASDIRGQQPNIGVDTKGIIRLVYGDKEKIYCITSANNGKTFSSAMLVGELKGMHLGHSRGPQIASSKNYSMITAIDKKGDIHAFKLNHQNNIWTKADRVNDKNDSAEEGLMALTADKDDRFYATWLDIRSDNKNNIYFSSMEGKESDWSKNRMVYKSPDEHVCECCKPNITFNDDKLVIGFRNWLMGSRDIYYIVSTNKGKTFSAAEKSGTGTWKLNACPMDGGGLAVTEDGIITAAWRRNSDIFYSTANREQKVGTGRDVSLAANKSTTLIAWHEKNNIKVFNPEKNKTVELGKGMSPKVYLLPKGKAICVWEDDKTIRYKVI
ncbi:MAG TPA: hypothetical protein VNI52_14395 [Sphingobacteriaceae bacterium]|nr:hypothetical protein [Sphingobacteriaceae bacterium]